MPDSKETFGTAPFVGGEGKTLLIGRHAKSSWDIGTLNDFDRPLNDRGKKGCTSNGKKID